jgi:hypothetical protein
MSDFKFKLDRQHINKIPQSQVIDELKRVAEVYNYRSFTRHEFDKVSKSCKGSKVLSVFGSWSKALEAIGRKLEKRQVDRSIIPTKALFEEMERIWRLIGHRPSKNEWDIQKPKYSYTTYKTRFKGWTNACLKFIEYKSGAILDDASILKEKVKENLTEEGRRKIDSQDLRTIPLKLRLKVLERDGFCCAFCGRSPATGKGVRLHIDHKLSFAKGGKTTLDNLQTLCYECNLGKGDAVMNRQNI